MKKHYEALGLNEGAPQAEIQAAYDRLSKELDPTKHNNEEFFVEEYKKVQEAYKALSNSSILATEKGAKNQENTGPDLNNNESSMNNLPQTNSKLSKHEYAFGGLLFFIATGIWGIFLQNMGFFVPSDDFTQKVRVVNTVGVEGKVKVTDGSVKVSEGKVDVNLKFIDGKNNFYEGRTRDRFWNNMPEIPVYIMNDDVPVYRIDQ